MIGIGGVLGGVGGCVPYDEIAGNVSLGADYTHPADGVVAFTVTSLISSGVMQVEFRRVDANNALFADVAANGDLKLRQRLAGTGTTLSTAAGVVAAGHRVVMVFEGTSVTFYSNGVLRFANPSVSNFATATLGQLRGLGTGGAVSDIRAWTLACRASEGV
jgi:hypothetical protein